MSLPKSLTTVTTLSKLVALALFVALPFIGFILGIQYANNSRMEELIIPKPYPDIEYPRPTSEVSDEPKIIVEYPQPNDVVTSPLIVKGKAKGSWFFEGTFPVTLYYGSAFNEFVQGVAKAKGEWMTTDFVEFEVILNFPLPKTNEGKLVLSRDNPSGLDENNEEITIPVRFK